MTKNISYLHSEINEENKTIFTDYESNSNDTMVIDCSSRINYIICLMATPLLVGGVLLYLNHSSLLGTFFSFWV